MGTCVRGHRNVAGAGVVGLGLALVALMALAAGCSSSGAGRASPAPSPSPTSPASASPTVAASASSSVSPGAPTGGVTATSPVTAQPTRTVVPAASRCHTSGLTGRWALVPGSAGAGHVVAQVTLTNRTRSTCRVYGYIGMQLLGSGGSTVPTNVTRTGPGAAATISLAPGASAVTDVRFSPDIPGPGEPQSGACEPAAYSVQITPPDETTQLVSQIFVNGAASHETVCERGLLQIGPVHRPL
jgi:hypothetical protein